MFPPPPLKYYWFVLMCFLKHHLGTEKTETGVLQSHGPSHCQAPNQNGREDWCLLFLPHSQLLRLLRLAKEICLTTRSTKGIQIENGHPPSPPGQDVSSSWHSPERGRLSFFSPEQFYVCSFSRPHYFLYIFIYMQINDDAIWKPPPVPLRRQH